MLEMMEAFEHLVLPETECKVATVEWSKGKHPLNFHYIIDILCTDNLIFHMHMLVEGNGYILFFPKIIHTSSLPDSILLNLGCHLP